MIESFFWGIQFQTSRDVFYITILCQAYYLPSIAMVVAVSLFGASIF